MKPYYKITGSIKNYAWGSIGGIAHVLGKPVPSGEPEAEYWMGAHPASPSTIESGTTIGLDAFIAQDPKGSLGERTATRFMGTLPFLFKVLSAGKPLSLQVHPAKDVAERGYRRETEAGLSITDPNRNYHDRNHKPELLLALTPFTAMCGFTSIEAMVSNFFSLDEPILTRIAEKMQNEHNLREMLIDLFKLNLEDITHILSRVSRNIRENRYPDKLPLYRMIETLSATYGLDRGILSPLYLNLLELSPGEALYVQSGWIHSYIEGTALELMANSNNVIRCGLTVKHIDIQELISVVRTEAGIVQKISGPHGQELVYPYRTPTEDFELVAIQLQGGIIDLNTQVPSITLCLEGSLTLVSPEEPDTLVSKGDSFFIPASGKKVRLQGKGTCYLATLPENRDR
jgi:mannose-6-phosphate isomerase